MLYRDQLQTMLGWNQTWSSPEQICAISTLCQQLRDADKKFIHNIITCYIHRIDEDTQSLEGAANNQQWTERLLQEDPGKIASALCAHLPLVKERHLSDFYIQLVRKLLTYSLAHNELLEESRQVIAYALLHPIFEQSQNDRQLLADYSQQLQEKMIFEADLEKDSDATSISSSDGHLFRSSDSLRSSVSDDTDEKIDSDLDDKNTFLEPDSGMLDVPGWLKSLRLHKYQYLFAKLTYDEMLQLDEEKLEENKVTKGARDKIALCIKKLRERYTVLVRIEEEVNKRGTDMKTSTLREILSELKSIIQTPLRPAYHDHEDIPAQFTKVLGKIYGLLHFSNRNDEDILTSFLSIADLALRNSSFIDQQKENIRKWQEIIQNIYHQVPKLRKSRSGQGLRRQPRPSQLSGRTRGCIRGPSHHHQRSLQNTNLTNPMQLNYSMSQTPSAFTSSFSPGPLSPPQIFHKRASSFDPNVIQRSSSYTSAESLNLPASQLSLHRSQMSMQPSLQSSAASLTQPDRLDIASRLDRDMLQLDQLNIG